ncbi:MAG: Argininosuccinate synthase [uncultured Chloroflexi bacterium]|uniref:argininosuccinate synthase n=1 Tax=uncultured Chloroflexota bacterium TaxID=166587 RepID=A0A6J4HJI5_9CHLR|nr:MAG: Argininosuccinate synthase [uncultured Chloroflexota bacterium]
MRVEDLKGKKIGGLVSGGLDSTTITHWLRAQGAEPHCITLDLGQPDEPDLDVVRQRMLACGAASAVVLDGKEALAEAGLKVIQAQARYEGGYWNTTGIARYVTTRLAIETLRAQGIDILFHGATGRGNDQVRFQLATNMLAPQMEVYAPWRDPAMLDTFGGRKEMVEYAAAYNLPIRASLEKIYSTDANMLGLTHEAGQLEDLETGATLITPEMGVWAWDAPDAPVEVSVTWRAGRPVAFDGVEQSLDDVFRAANAVGGEHGIGIGRHVVENRFVGIKSRGVYEAPGMELLGQSYEFLLQLYLDRRARELFEHLSRFVAVQVYQGYWYDLATTAALDALDRYASLVDGTVKLRLYKGNVVFQGATGAEGGLYAADDSSMERAGSFDHADAEGFLRVLGVPARNYAHRMFGELKR